MKNVLIHLILLVLLLPATYAQSPNNLTRGTWANEDHTIHVKFTQKGKSYSAQLVWMVQPNNENGNPKQDVNNPEKGLRNRPVLGIPIIWGLELKDKQWIDGTIYSPKKGILAKCQLEMPDTNTLVLKISKGIFSATKTWKRIK